MHNCKMFIFDCEHSTYFVSVWLSCQLETERSLYADCICTILAVFFCLLSFPFSPPELKAWRCVGVV